MTVRTGVGVFGAMLDAVTHHRLGTEFTRLGYHMMESATEDQKRCMAGATLIPQILECMGMQSLLPEGFSSTYGRLVVEEVQQDTPWALALVETEQRPEIRQVLDDPRIRLSFPMEVRDNLRRAVESSIQMFLMQAQTARPITQQELLELPYV